MIRSACGVLGLAALLVLYFLSSTLAWAALVTMFVFVMTTRLGHAWAFATDNLYTAGPVLDRCADDSLMGDLASLPARPRRRHREM
jgi:hypothetical protein